MFMTLMNGLAWIVVIGLGVLAFMLVGAAIGALFGNAWVGIRGLLKR